MKLCRCGHPIITLQGEPESEECFCCQHGIRLGSDDAPATNKLGKVVDAQGETVIESPKRKREV